jgi:hypothetical protein
VAIGIERLGNVVGKVAILVRALQRHRRSEVEHVRTRFPVLVVLLLRDERGSVLVVLLPSGRGSYSVLSKVCIYSSIRH